MKVTLEFYWFYFYFLQASIHLALGLNSHRSHVIDNGRPILRMAVDDDDDDNNISTNQDENTTEPIWLKELRSRIPQFVNEYGYQKAKPHIKQLVEDTEKQKHVLLHVEVSKNGAASIEVGPTFRNRKRKYKNKKRARSQRDGELETDPVWLKEFKKFTQALVESYGRNKTLQMMDNLIQKIQKEHVVSIQDVDGEVLVEYFNTKKQHRAPDSKEVREER